MDGFAATALARPPSRMTTARPARAGWSGRLGLPDLDAPPPPPPAAGASFAEQLDAAWREGEAAGRVAGHADGLADAASGLAARVADTLAAARTALAGAEVEAAALAETNAVALARLLLAAFDAALPDAAARDGVALIARTATALRPALEARPEAALSVAPALVDAVAAAIPFLAVLPDPALPPGDARIAWRDGSTTLDLEARRRAVREALGRIGLTPESIA